LVILQLQLDKFWDNKASFTSSLRTGCLVWSVIRAAAMAIKKSDINSIAVMVSVAVYFRWTWAEINTHWPYYRDVYCWRRSCCQWSTALLMETYLSSRKTMHQHIALVTQSSFCVVRHRIHLASRVAGQRSWPKSGGLPHLQVRDARACIY